MNPERPQRSRGEQSRGIWGEHALNDGETRSFEIGPLTLHCRAAGKDIWVASQYSEEQYSRPGLREGAGPQDWNRWALSHESRRIRLSPALPELPVVVKPESPFHLAPQAEARIYVRVAMSVRIESIGPRNEKLIESPTAILSKTWWGSFTGGEMAYWITSSARRKAEVDPERWFMAICPMRVVNGSDHHLAIEKFLAHTAGLSLYRDGQGQIWASLANIRYRGGMHFSQIDVSDGPPEECGDGKEIAPPRHPATRSIIGKTFGSILEWAGFD